MAHDSHPPAPVPAEMLAKHREGWHAFTRGMFWNAIGVAAALVFLFLIGKVF